MSPRHARNQRKGPGVDTLIALCCRLSWRCRRAWMGKAVWHWICSKPSLCSDLASRIKKGNTKDAPVSLSLKGLTLIESRTVVPIWELEDGIWSRIASKFLVSRSPYTLSGFRFRSGSFSTDADSANADCTDKSCSTISSALSSKRGLVPMSYLVDNQHCQRD